MDRVLLMEREARECPSRDLVILVILKLLAIQLFHAWLAGVSWDAITCPSHSHHICPASGEGLTCWASLHQASCFMSSAMRRERQAWNFPFPLLIQCSFLVLQNGAASSPTPSFSTLPSTSPEGVEFVWPNCSCWTLHKIRLFKTLVRVTAAIVGAKNATNYKYSPSKLPMHTQDLKNIIDCLHCN